MTVTPTAGLYGDGDYLRSYYTDHTDENRDLGGFLSRTSAHLTGQRCVRVLDAGCGPTILYWSVFLSEVSELVGCDAEPCNLTAATKIQDEILHGSLRPGFVAAAEHALTLQPRAAASPSQLLRQRALALQDLSTVDLGGRWPYASQAFDHVVSCFALDCLPSWRHFDAALIEALRVVRPRGALVLALVANSTGWRCGDVVVPTLQIDGKRLHDRLVATGWSDIEIEELPARDAFHRSQGYDRVVMSCARSRT